MGAQITSAHGEVEHLARRQAELLIIRILVCQSDSSAQNDGYEETKYMLSFHKRILRKSFALTRG